MMSVLGMTLALSGCMGRYALDRKPVKQISEGGAAIARSRVAYDRAPRERVGEVQASDMSPEEVQATSEP